MTTNWRWLSLGLLLGLLVWASWAFINPPAPQKANSEALPIPVTGYYPGGAKCDPSKLADETARIEFRDQCADAVEEHRLKQDDLEQQHRSAAAAETMAALSVSQTRALALATIIGLLTLFAAAIAAYFAREAAREAGKAVVDARAQSSAHLLVSEATMRLTPGNNPAPNDMATFDFMVTAQNVGPTRARISALSASLDFRGRTYALDLANALAWDLPPETKMALRFAPSDLKISTAALMDGDFQGDAVRLTIEVLYLDIYGHSKSARQSFDGAVYRPSFQPGERLHTVNSGMMPTA